MATSSKSANEVEAHILEGLAQALCGEFVTDEEMGAFFARYADPQRVFE